MLPLSQAGAQQNNARAVAEAYNASGHDLYQRFATSPGNIVFSPYSIGTAMAMALSGARGATERETATVLKHRLKRDEIEAGNSDIIATLNGYGRNTAPSTCPAGFIMSGNQCECPPSAVIRGERCTARAATPPPSARLLTANALMLTKHGDLISKAYATLLQSKYAADVFQNASLAEINGWVDRKTEGKIDKILERLDPDSAAVLLNAVYFKSRWDSPFNERATRTDVFNISRTGQVRVPLMSQTGRFSLVRQAGYRVIRLPYVIRDLAMVIALPDEIDGLGEVSRRLNPAMLSSLSALLRDDPRPVRLELPRFKTEYRADLVPTFRQAGLKLAFDDRQADFSGITGRPAKPPELYISQIVHRAVIDVTEESTEAAAATAIETARPTVARPDPPPELFRVDRPFLFYIVDSATGAILFQGSVADPSQTTASR